MKFKSLLRQFIFLWLFDILILKWWWNIFNIFNTNKRSLSFLTSFETLSTSFGGKGPHLRQWLVTQLLLMVSKPRFYGAFLSYKVNGRRSVHSPQYRLIITLSLVDRHYTRGKCPLARNQDRSWWHCHTSIMLFWLQPMAPWTTKVVINISREKF